MIQWKQTNDPPWVSRRVHRLHHSHSMKTWKTLLNSFLFPDGGSESVEEGDIREECRKRGRGQNSLEGSKKNVVITITTTLVLLLMLKWSINGV